MSERSLVLRTPPGDGVSVVHAALEELWDQSPGLAAWDRMSFETALIELTSNVLQHSGSTGDVVCVVDISITDSEMRAVLSDQGGEAPADITAPREMPGEWAEAGRGIPFIQALVTEFDYRRVDDRNVWSIMRTRRRS